MSSRTLLLAPLSLALAPLMIAQSANQPAPTPPPVARALPAPMHPAVPPATQRVYGPTSDPLITREAAETVTGNFRKAYVKADAAPRIVVYVNRALIDTAAGAKLTGRTENYETTDNSTKRAGTNTYSVKDGTAPTLADQQTVREIERLVGRAFRNAGAQLADQKTAAALLPDAGSHLVGDHAARDREALSKIADIAIEVLISSRNITVPQVSGDVTLPVPDIQATAIRLKDSAIIGQAAASDILGKGMQAGRIVQQFDVRDITEATALALMEDMLTGTK
jgi:hypothetical protein